MGSLVCRIELNKTDGITITVEDADADITQTVVLDGSSITITSTGAETSTIVQKPDSIEMTCKTFKLDAATIQCTSEQSITLDADTISCTSEQTIDLTATGAMTLQGATIDLN